MKKEREEEEDKQNERNRWEIEKEIRRKQDADCTDNGTKQA